MPARKGLAELISDSELEIPRLMKKRQTLQREQYSSRSNLALTNLSSPRCSPFCITCKNKTEQYHHTHLRHSSMALHRILSWAPQHTKSEKNYCQPNARLFRFSKNLSPFINIYQFGCWMDLSRALQIIPGVNIPVCNTVAKTESFPKASKATKNSSPHSAILFFG